MFIEVPAGQRVQATLTFKNENGVPTDPDTAAATVRHPDGTEDAYAVGGANALTQESEGIFTLTFVPDAKGRWYITATGTGILDVASTPDYVLVV